MNNWHDWMNDALIRSMIIEYADQDPSKLALQWSAKRDLPVQWMLQQIEGRQKAKSKLPTWFENENVVFPDRTAIEQSSSEITASYKQQFAKGKKVMDLTGGMGVDTCSFAKVADEVIYLEPDPLRFEIARHNFKAFGYDNIQCVNGIAEDAESLIDQFKPDLIYVDPSRRDKNKRVFRFEEMQPEILPLLSQWLVLCENILVKTSPMLDIKSGIRQLEKVQEVHVVSMKDECRELLFLIHNQLTSDPSVHCVEFSRGRDWKYSFRYSKEEKLELKTSPVTAYLMDPFASVTKAGAFKSLTDDFNISLLNANTHLYTGHEKPKGFPGRIFKVIEVFPYDPGLIRESIPDKKAHLVFRNFPIETDEVSKKLKFTSEGNTYLFFVTDHAGKLRVIRSEM